MSDNQNTDFASQLAKRIDACLVGTPQLHLKKNGAVEVDSYEYIFNFKLGRSNINIPIFVTDLSMNEDRRYDDALSHLLAFVRALEIRIQEGI